MRLLRELLGEDVPEDRGGGSGIWSREEDSPLGKVRVLHWAVSKGEYTSIGFGLGQYFPEIYLKGHLECRTVNLYEMYFVHFFKLADAQLLTAILAYALAQAKEEGEQAAQFRIRKALGIPSDYQ